MTTVSKEERSERRVDVDGVTLVWGEPALWKARLRSESRQRHLEQPLAERLRAAIAMVQPRRTAP